MSSNSQVQRILDDLEILESSQVAVRDEMNQGLRFTRTVKNALKRVVAVEEQLKSGKLPIADAEKVSAAVRMTVEAVSAMLPDLPITLPQASAQMSVSTPKPVKKSRRGASQPGTNVVSITGSSLMDSESEKKTGINPMGYKLLKYGFFGQLPKSYEAFVKKALGKEWKTVSVWTGKIHRTAAEDLKLGSDGRLFKVMVASLKLMADLRTGKLKAEDMHGRVNSVYDHIGYGRWGEDIEALVESWKTQDAAKMA